jgi:protein TonB
MPAVRPLSRNTAIAGSVVLFHVAALWALQTGLLRQAIEVIVPVSVMSEITPPEPKVEPPPPSPPARPKPIPVEKPVVAQKVQPRLPPPPQPVAIADPTPAPNAPTGVLTPQPPPPPIAAPVAPPAPAPAPAAPPAPAAVELPSKDADYLQNPKPAYPPISKRLGEEGKVLVRVLIGADGTPQKAELRQSSGFDRLDQSALATAMRWRYVPGKRGGVPETMWFTVPIIFVLE